MWSQKKRKKEEEPQIPSEIIWKNLDAAPMETLSSY
jgi:hypothetical protein